MSTTLSSTERMACAMALAAVVALGCLVPSECHALYGNQNYYWPRPSGGAKPVDINVCWENPNAATTQWRSDRQRAIESSISRYSRVNFHQWDTCQNNEAGLHIRICTASGQAGCDAYPSSQGSHGVEGNGLNDGIELNVNHAASISIHEMMHSIGYYHEEERPEYDGTATGSGNCAKQSWPNPKPQLLGAYDKNSIMSYCNAGSSLSPTDVAGLQRVYGRHIPGSIVSPSGYCAAAHYAVGLGDTAFLWKCDEANDDQEWNDYPSAGNDRYLALNGASGKKCLGPATNVAGSDIKLTSCTATKDWVFENMFIRGFGGLCLDLKNGNTTNGNPIQMYQCNALSGAYQRWSLGSDGKLRYGSLSSTKCGTIVNKRLVIGACSSASVFTFNSQRIRFGTSCLDVLGPSDAQFISGLGTPSNGNVIQTFTCNTALNQQWNLNGQIRYANNKTNCLARDNGLDANGVKLKLSPCANVQSFVGSAQEWDYYF